MVNKEYEILQFYELKLLIKAINQRISDGWEPIGGIQVVSVGDVSMRKDRPKTTSRRSCKYCQAIIFGFKNE